MKPGRGVAIAHRHTRERVPHRESDYLYQDDLRPCLDIIRTARLQQAVTEEIGPIH